ncbi:MAG: dTDP-4-dehydrorhamnose reductase [Gammaproteobacteria bacterium]|nr:dTDP-4-dehydrorhamnose reductase [Gammaproteobacteria bacterium]
MKILVFGKSGQVATEIRRQAEVISLGRDQVDLRDPSACAKAIADSDAEVVINAAAYTDVDGAESNEIQATIINGDSPTAMAHAAADRGIPFLHVSSDYVFDGSGHQPWLPGDRVSPLNAYGRSKVKGEVGICSSGCNYAIFRTSWIFSSFGNNFVKTMLKLSQSHDRLDIIADQFGGPTPASDVARLLLIMSRALREGETGGMFHYSGSPDVSWADFTREIFSQTSSAVVVNEIPSADYSTVAKRPLNSRLNCCSLEEKFGITRPDWKNGLHDVIKTMENVTR